MKTIKTKLQETSPDQVEAFEKGAQAFAKKIVGNFKNYEFVRITCHSLVHTANDHNHSTLASP